ncbi:hypothetical protein [Chryseobacterium luquanense]|uniref:Molecular chaperone n=1 Tax=Chryseobacterium luquanense TaxID=2983766 RepID=A0ABT3Y7U3_9FLAO|nr:hypothetical protein [Chryseobacterium luquanense]MCX8534238.1 hypothetical protein [Chryseobacterium luquanense]
MQSKFVTGKIIIFTSFIISSFLYSQEKVIISNAKQYGDFIELSLEIENKPNDKFHLIKIDTITTKTNKDEFLKDNHNVEQIFQRANVLIRYQIPSKKFKTVDIKGKLRYFKPAEQNKSYLKLDKVKNLKKNTNLINPNTANTNVLYFSIVDSEEIKKAFIKLKDNENFKKIDFKFYDLMYAFKSSKNQDFLPVVNDEIEFGYNNLTLRNPETGISYKMIKLKKEMTDSERNEIRIDLLIENKVSVKKIPFEFNTVEIKNL